MVGLYQTGCFDGDGNSDGGRTKYYDGGRTKYYDGGRTKYYDGGRTKYYDGLVDGDGFIQRLMFCKVDKVGEIEMMMNKVVVRQLVQWQVQQNIE